MSIILGLDRPTVVGLIKQANSCCSLQPAVVTGWGDTQGTGSDDKLREVTVTVSNQAQCDQLYNSVGGQIFDHEICALAPGKDSCFGDSGGPLVHEETSGRYTLIGVVSRGPPNVFPACAHPTIPGAYVRVTSVLDWIKREIASVGICNTSPPPPPSPTPPPPSPTPPPTGNCMTVSGPSPGMQCIFPFTIGGITHTACTTQHSDPGDLPWCSTQVDANGNHVQERHFYL